MVDAATRDRWVAETAQKTLERIENLNGTNPNAVQAREHYHTDAAVYKQMAKNALTSLISE